jgi:tetratricopeptide (TPR) repeat protein
VVGNYYISSIKHIIYILLFLISFNGFAQFSDEEQHQIDSLNEVIANPSSHDTSLAGAYVALSEILGVSNLDTLIPLCEKAQIISKKALNSKPPTPVKKNLLNSLSDALHNIGYAYENKDDIPMALKYYLKGLKVDKETGNKRNIASSSNYIGMIYKNQGDIPKALEFYYTSLKICEKVGDKDMISSVLNNIGLIYLLQDDFPKALDSFHKSLKLSEEIGDKQGVCDILNSIGQLYWDQGELPKALEYYHKSLKIREEVGDKYGIANSLNNIGLVYDTQGDGPKAIEFYLQGLKMLEEIGEKEGTASLLINIGIIEFEKKNNSGLETARQHYQKALNLAEELGYPYLISNASGRLSQVYEKQGKGMKALEMYKLYVQMKDSINNEETQKASIRQQTKYEFEKAQIVKENEAKEEARLESEATGRRDNIQYSLIFLGILVLFGIVLSLGFIKVSPTIAEGIIFFAFLILFEFVLVFTEPYMEQYTNGEPMYNLLANSVLALVIFPLHAILEKLLKKRIVKV